MLATQFPFFPEPAYEQSLGNGFYNGQTEGNILMAFGLIIAV